MGWNTGTVKAGTWVCMLPEGGRASSPRALDLLKGRNVRDEEGGGPAEVRTDAIRVFSLLGRLLRGREGGRPDSPTGPKVVRVVVVGVSGSDMPSDVVERGRPSWWVGKGSWSRKAGMVEEGFSGLASSRFMVVVVLMVEVEVSEAVAIARDRGEEDGRARLADCDRDRVSKKRVASDA
jgi:hypothetical protein